MRIQTGINLSQYSCRVIPAESNSSNADFTRYGKLDGPLVELEFATISGVRLGFGYNSIVHLPKADQLYEFPFISDSGGAGGDDPRKILDIIKGGNPPFVAAKEGACWFAAVCTMAQPSSSANSA